mmetsp:Transcript_27935/g.43588  ORF Transcript_27935/g.43588 Transcript_27935/m.43588 type:complete len:127 (+) Transcript_27935:1678-2058(+)
MPARTLLIGLHHPIRFLTGCFGKNQHLKYDMTDAASRSANSIAHFIGLCMATLVVANKEGGSVFSVTGNSITIGNDQRRAPNAGSKTQSISDQVLSHTAFSTKLPLFRCMTFMDNPAISYTMSPSI